MGTVLIVDDYADNCLVLLRLFKRANIEARSASSAAEAMEALVEGPPDVILLDVAMPNVDGMSLLHELRADRRWDRVAVLIYTALFDPVQRDLALASGAQDYIQKGIEFPRLRALVEPHLIQVGVDP